MTQTNEGKRNQQKVDDKNLASFGGLHNIEKIYSGEKSFKGVNPMSDSLRENLKNKNKARLVGDVTPLEGQDNSEKKAKFRNSKEKSGPILMIKDAPENAINIQKPKLTIDTAAPAKEEKNISPTSVAVETEVRKSSVKELAERFASKPNEKSNEPQKQAPKRMNIADRYPAAVGNNSSTISEVRSSVTNPGVSVSELRNKFNNKINTR